FYGVAAYYAFRSLGQTMSGAVRPRTVVVGATLVLLAATWQIRAVSTVENARRTAWRNQMEWLADLPKRRAEFADRPVYTKIMESMVAQGTKPGSPEPTHYPEWLARTLLPRP